jgi:hypothetical protein
LLFVFASLGGEVTRPPRRGREIVAVAVADNAHVNVDRVVVEVDGDGDGFRFSRRGGDATSHPLGKALEGRLQGISHSPKLRVRNTRRVTVSDAKGVSGKSSSLLIQVTVRRPAQRSSTTSPDRRTS